MAISASTSGGHRELKQTRLADFNLLVIGEQADKHEDITARADLLEPRRRQRRAAITSPVLQGERGFASACMAGADEWAAPGESVIGARSLCIGHQ